MYPAILLCIIFTLFTTLWCCVRPNFPSFYDSKLRVFSTKLNLILWVLICPEAVLYWAMRQWFEAGRVGKEFQDRGWTRRHGLFLLMGGFVLCRRDGKPFKLLSSGQFGRLLNGNVIEFPTLTSLEIREQSNFHPVIGLIALVQSIWFLMHCLSHIINISPAGTTPPLPAITQLEAITATIVISSWCIFFFAWEKPLDGRTPILLQPTDDHSTRRNGDQPTVDQAFELEQIKFQLEYPQTQTTSSRFFIRFKPTTRLLVAVLLWLPKSVFRDIVGLVLPEYYLPDFQDGILKMPLFYVNHTLFRPILLLPPAVLSSCISVISLLFVVPLDSRTPYHFPSEDAQRIWHIASVITTIFSASMLCFNMLTSCFYFLTLVFPNNWECMSLILMTLSEICFAIVIAIVFIGFVPFLIARCVLFVASLVQFGSTPGEVLVGHSWTNYVPHFP